MGKWTGKTVAVLYGGRSSEREVSLKTGAACAEALQSRGLDVTLVDVGLDVADRLRAGGAEVAFVALHGRYGEDGSIQGLLESHRHPLHRLGRAGLGGGHGQGALQAALQEPGAGGGRVPGLLRRSGPRRSTPGTSPSPSRWW